MKGIPWPPCRTCNARAYATGVGPRSGDPHANYMDIAMALSIAIGMGMGMGKYEIVSGRRRRPAAGVTCVRGVAGSSGFGTGRYGLGPLLSLGVSMDRSQCAESIATSSESK